MGSPDDRGPRCVSPKRSRRGAPSIPSRAFRRWEHRRYLKEGDDPTVRFRILFSQKVLTRTVNTNDKGHGPRGQGRGDTDRGRVVGPKSGL